MLWRCNLQFFGDYDKGRDSTHDFSAHTKKTAKTLLKNFLLQPQMLPLGKHFKGLEIHARHS